MPENSQECRLQTGADPLRLRDAAAGPGAGIEPLLRVCRLRHRMAGTGRRRGVRAGNSMMRWLSRLLAISGMAAALTVLAAPAQAEKRVALVIGNNDYRNVPKLQKAVNDARTMGDTLKQLGFTVMVAENQTGRRSARRCWPSTRRSRRATRRSSSMPATASRSPARTSCCRPMCRRRPKARKNWCATPRSSPTASSSGCRTRKRAPRSWCSMPAATIRSNARGTRAVAGGGGLAPMTQLPEGVFSMFSAGPRQTALDRLSNDDDNPEFGVHPHLRERTDAARRQPGPGRAAHAAPGQRAGRDACATSRSRSISTRWSTTCS